MYFSISHDSHVPNSIGECDHFPRNWNVKPKWVYLDGWYIWLHKQYIRILSERGHSCSPHQLPHSLSKLIAWKSLSSNQLLPLFPKEQPPNTTNLKRMEIFYYSVPKLLLQNGSFSLPLSHWIRPQRHICCLIRTQPPTPFDLSLLNARLYQLHTNVVRKILVEISPNYTCAQVPSCQHFHLDNDEWNVSTVFWFLIWTHWCQEKKSPA